MAVLILDSPVGKNELSINPEEPTRGEWNTIASLGKPGEATSKEVNTFNVVTLGALQIEGTKDKSSWYVAGVEPFRRAKDQLDRSAPGLSGSPVVTILPNHTPVVNGINAGGYPAGMLGPEDFRDGFNCFIDPHSEYKNAQAGFMVPSTTIQAAITAAKAQAS